MTLLEFVDQLRAEAELLRTRYDDRGRARLCEVHADDLEALLEKLDDELLPIGAAVEESGYAAGSLRRMARDGVLPNRAQLEGEYLFRRGDLPRKPGYQVQKPVPASRGVAVMDHRMPTSRRQIARAVVSGGRP